jgi:D-alanine-D-alanine ligase-like ATP-grasp enzyme
MAPVMDDKKYTVTEFLKVLVPKINATLISEPEFENVGFIVFKDGKKEYYKNTSFSLNSFAAAEIARDKNYTNFFLKRMGYKVPEGQTFFSNKLNSHLHIKRTIHDGFEYAASLGFPVIIKPNNFSQGRLVTKIYNESEYYETAEKIFEITDVMLVERFCYGNDFRVLVLDEEVYAAYQREPLKIIGNGASCIKELIAEKQNDFVKARRKVDIDCNDYRLIHNLKRNNYTMDTILDRGVAFQILDNANLSTGGMIYDVTSSIHQEYKKLAVAITKDMRLRLCGVDFLTEDICKPISDYTLIEINASPGLNNYASLGAEQLAIVHSFYFKVLELLEKGI